MEELIKQNNSDLSKLELTIFANAFMLKGPISRDFAVFSPINPPLDH
jgi:hypothetical protein